MLAPKNVLISIKNQSCFEAPVKESEKFTDWIMTFESISGNVETESENRVTLATGPVIRTLDASLSLASNKAKPTGS